MVKQEVIFASIILSGALLVGYGIYLVPDEVFQVYQYYSGINKSVGMVFAKVVDLLPLVVGIKMLWSPLLFQSLVSSEAVLPDDGSLADLSTSMRKVAGVVVLVVGFSFCFEAFVEFYDPSSLPSYAIETTYYVWHLSNVISLSALTLFGVFLCSGISLRKVIRKLQTAGIDKNV